MKKIVYSFFLFAFGVTLWQSNSSGAGINQGADRTGSPIGIGNCGSCHAGGDFSPSINLTLLDGAEPVTSYLPGKTYTMQVRISATNGPSRYGFQAVALTQAGNLQAGTFGAAPGGFRITPLSGRQYVEHSSPRASESFSISWTAPQAGTGPVRFYASGIAANNQDGSGGDSPTNLTTPVTIAENVTSTNRQLPSLVGEFTVFPNPLQEVLHLKGEQILTGRYQLRLFDSQGRLVGQHTVSSIGRALTFSWPLARLQAGSYYLQVSTGDTQRTFPLIKE